jgi:hypothetical protein
VALFRLTIIKSFQYRGATEEWSNSYTISGTTPADAAAWTAWGEKLKDIEKPIVTNQVTFVKWYGYAPGSWETKPQHVDFQGNYAAGQVGTMAFTGGQLLPGDAAFTIRWDTGQFTSRGKKIYLRKYFHTALGDSATVSDNLLPAQRTAAGVYAAKLYDGTSLIGTARMARDTGTLPIAHLVSPYVTTRTLKRRGKRNPTP